MGVYGLAFRACRGFMDLGFRFTVWGFGGLGFRGLEFGV